VADADGDFQKAKIEADAYFEKQQRIAEAVRTEAVTEARGIREMNDAMNRAGGETLVKLKIAESLQGKKIILLPMSEGGMNLKTTDMNQLIETLGVKSLAPQKQEP
jgi:regulator of protease activity HflC (stomatin/prohibitin superfamily)